MIQFEEVKKGYNKEQVQAFFEKVGLEYGKMYREYEALYSENESLRRENAKLRSGEGGIELTGDAKTKIEELEKACQEREAQIASLQREIEAADHFLKGKMELIAKSIMEAEAKSKEIVERGKKEAVSLIADAEDQAEQIRKLKHAARMVSQDNDDHVVSNILEQAVAAGDQVIDENDEEDENYVYPFLRAEARRKAGELEW